MDDIEQKVKDQAYMEAALMVANLQDENEKLLSIIREIVSQIDQGGENGKVFARDNCIQKAREVL